MEIWQDTMTNPKQASKKKFLAEHTRSEDLIYLTTHRGKIIKTLFIDLNFACLPSSLDIDLMWTMTFSEDVYWKTF